MEKGGKEKAANKLINEFKLSTTDMVNTNTVTISFDHLEQVYNSQKDLLDILQASLSSDIRHDAGYYVIDLIGKLAELQFNMALKAGLNASANN